MQDLFGGPFQLFSEPGKRPGTGTSGESQARCPAKILIVKEGEYHSYNISIGYTSAEFPFAKPFRVEAGRINYVGDFTYESVGGARINMDQFDNRDETMADAYRQFPAMLEYPFVSIFE